MKYKIIYKNGKFMPQIKEWIFWIGFKNHWPISESQIGLPVDFETKKEAINFIKEYHCSPDIKFQ